MYKIICRSSAVFISVLLENSWSDLLKSKKNFCISLTWNCLKNETGLIYCYMFLLLYVHSVFLCFIILYTHYKKKKQKLKDLLPAYLLMTACKVLQYRSFIYARMLPKCSFFQLAFVDLIVRYHASWQEYDGKL